MDGPGRAGLEVDVGFGDDFIRRTDHIAVGAGVRGGQGRRSRADLVDDGAVGEDRVGADEDGVDAFGVDDVGDRGVDAERDVQAVGREGFGDADALAVWPGFGDEDRRRRGAAERRQRSEERRVGKECRL